MNVRNLLIATSIIHHGDWHQIVDSFTKKDVPNQDEADRLCSTLKCKALTILDAEYPSYLKYFYQPPLVLFYYGDISLIKDYKNNIAVVGSRNPSADGIRNTNSIVSSLAKKMVIVSGLASGIDRLAHESAINAGGKTIAIIGSGIDVCFPSVNEDIYKEIKENHLLLSEYYNDEPPTGDHFPMRNRLISMFSRATLITEGHLRSGTSITASYTVNFGKPLYCVPSNDLENSLCNELIREGALLVRNSDDIFYDLENLIMSS